MITERKFIDRMCLDMTGIENFYLTCLLVKGLSQKEIAELDDETDEEKKLIRPSKAYVKRIVAYMSKKEFNYWVKNAHKMIENGDIGEEVLEPDYTVDFTQKIDDADTERETTVVVSEMSECEAEYYRGFEDGYKVGCTAACEYAKRHDECDLSLDFCNDDNNKDEEQEDDYDLDFCEKSDPYHDTDDEENICNGKCDRCPYGDGACD